MAIEYKKQITFTKDSTIYGHQSLDEGGFPKDAGNGKVSQVLDLAENQTVDSLKSKISITIDLEDSRLYHFNIDDTSVATFEIPADRFLKSVTYDDVTKVLAFTFFTGSGEETVSVDLSSLVDTYTAGNGLTLSGGVFSIKLKSSETRLKVDSTGLYIDLSDILSKITAEETARKNADADLSGRIDTLTTTVEGIETRVDAKVTKAETAATNASNSATSASASATTATEKATAASNSASRASTSEANAKTSETNAKASEANAKASEDNASASEANAKLSETNANASETKAKTSETNAKASETSASASATKALASENNAKTSETNASTYAGQAKTSETNAKASETASKTYKEQAQSLLEQADLNLIESIEQTTTSTESSGKNVVTITQKDGTKSTFDIYNGSKGDTPTIPQASSSTAGIMKLFTSLGQNTDGAPTNKAVQDAISAISGHYVVTTERYVSKLGSSEDFIYYYRKWSDGMIEQFGYTTSGNTLLTNQVQTITFPHPFSSAISYTVFMSLSFYGDYNNAIKGPHVMFSGNKTSTSFKPYIAWSNSVDAIGVNTFSDRPFSWYAIGN